MAIFIKYILGRYEKRQGQRYNSVALAGSGTEAIFGALLSASVFASAIIYLRFNISIEAYVGLLIAIIVIKDGLEMMS